MSPETKKFLWNTLDRMMFIGVGVLGTIATTYITGVLKLQAPKLVVTRTFNRVDDGAPASENIGGLKLDYKTDGARAYGVLRVDIANGGRGARRGEGCQVSGEDPDRACIGSILVERRIATWEEIEAATKASRISGGIKIAGLNPLILAASYLNLLAEKGILSLAKAQSILDAAKAIP